MQELVVEGVDRREEKCDVEQAQPDDTPIIALRCGGIGHVKSPSLVVK
jgi:hypothetical protein